ncbi:MAG: SsrA-binding protein [Verrucomicrobiales bacterium]|nr:SsrA-binding protein [Verrucomicrobiales bacterium]MBO60731.1 SsrA-binding protein [Verrucomicrobiales bacterium]|tara:strand:+ start:12931 stop:13389 length:459 start_codon:yes stop_codon:yes gene_type:complete
MSEIVKNSKARHDYAILETYEAGLALRGTEVKSLRAGKGQIREAFAKVDSKGEVWLVNAHIDEYAQGNINNHDPRAPRKLLLHRKEIDKLRAATQAKGCALVPLKMYWKKGKVKVLLGVGQGKTKGDKRESLRKRETDRQIRNATMRSLKGR